MHALVLGRNCTRSDQSIIDLEGARDGFEDIHQENQINQTHRILISDLVCQLTLEYIAAILKEPFDQLDHLRPEGKLHRKLKAADVLLSSTGEMSPEVIKQSGYDSQADIY
ncbi:putative protein serine/threonine kinase [Puccinia graminis f. sp. tritici]|uniref:Uncharacterized protein n=1 Tax=Puccinia graminis f. sp. tritici TaxID=56615 RepID=A0A5B0RXT9_PUCGR|nr:putative protein serine/threonine kinase [Puccinia graminis f. sp. tritici]KAA1130816.1 putative protein serine/threonine kinase [Puccinia graminis f. sp. tritici]